MARRAAPFILGFLCGALVFIALQGRTQNYVRCTESGWDCQPPELPALGAAPAKPGGGEKEEKKGSLIPLGVTAGLIGMMSLYGQGTNMPCATYPCAHYAHVGTGLLIGSLFTAYYGPRTALGVGLAMAVGKELLDKHDGKSFNRTDVVTRMLGTGVGIYLVKAF